MQVPGPAGYHSSRIQRGRYSRDARHVDNRDAVFGQLRCRRHLYTVADIMDFDMEGPREAVTSGVVFREQCPCRFWTYVRCNLREIGKEVGL